MPGAVSAMRRLELISKAETVKDLLVVLLDKNRYPKFDSSVLTRCRGFRRVELVGIRDWEHLVCMTIDSAQPLSICWRTELTVSVVDAEAEVST